MDTGSPLSPREQRIQQLLDRASQLPVGERDVFLSRECGEDQALRQQINEHLLTESKGLAKKKLNAQPGPVTSAVNQALIGSEHDRRVELLGKVVGDYRLVAIVGVGGAGTVYLGERADRAYSAQVAIKVVANTQLNHEVQRRFAAERQILANLNHPYIGRLLDAGETFFDEPFLVMEYVHGEALDRYCDNQRLGVVERIQLFLKICDAVQYAHRNLIVHRDLKPGNILVSKEGIPKLLDFGIAKLLDDSAMAVLQDGVIAHTRVHDRLLTPEYASPEQIRGQPVTTTSDVYALGVILYELLTGTRPYAVNAHNQLELERSICIQDAIKPSQRIAELAKHSLTTTDNAEHAKTELIAAARNTSFKKLEHQLQGDLDAIIQRALRKEPEKRYSSVEHLIDDLNRHLNQEPVEARQGNRWYYSQRFVRRHTVGVIAGTSALLSLIAVAVILSLQATRLKEQRDIATQQRDKATQESARAETVSNFMLDVFTAADPFQSQDKQVTAKELLDNAAKKIESSLNDQPEVKARLLEAIGEAYEHQGHDDMSVRYLEEGVTIQRMLSSSNGVELAKMLTSLGRTYFDKGNLDKASQQLMESRKLLQRSGHTKSEEYIRVLYEAASLQLRQGNIAIAQQDFQQSLALSRQIYGDHHQATANRLLDLSDVYVWQDNYSEAEKLIREAVTILHTTLPDKHPDRIAADISFGQLLYYRGKFTEAESIINQSLTDLQVVFGSASPRLINAYSLLSRIYLAQQRWELAEQRAKAALNLATANFGKTNFATATVYTLVASTLLHRHKYLEAKDAAQASLTALKATTTPDNQYIAPSEYYLALALINLHRGKEAEPILRQNMERWTRSKAPAWRAARTESLLGIVLLQLKKMPEAKQALTHAYEVLSAKDSGALADEIESAKKRLDQFQLCEKENHINNCIVEL